MTAKLVTLAGTYSPEQVEELFIKWRDENADQHRYSLMFSDDGRAAFQFDRLKFNWFEVDPMDFPIEQVLRKSMEGQG